MPLELCVVKKAGIELAAYPSGINLDSQADYAIKLEGDTAFHYIFEFSRNLLLLDDGRLAGSTTDAGGLFIVPVAMLKPYVVSTGPDTSVKAYRIPSSATSSVMVKDGSGNTIHAYRIDVSDNYLYAITEVYGRGGVLVDLSTLEARYVATDLVGSTSYNGNVIRQAVSADGKTVAMVDSASKRGKIYVIDDNCAGDIFIGPDTASCYSIDFSEQLKASSMLADTTPFELSFSSNNTLGMKSYIGSGGDGVIETTITPDPDAERLQYLALGDSYSSGEGDTERRVIVQPGIQGHSLERRRLI